jgi:ABC-type molybdenum transport system ATPase subunit/photorepair protein PhrA
VRAGADRVMTATLRRAGVHSTRVCPLGCGGYSQRMRPAEGESIIDVRDLRMRYGSKDVLNGVDFTVNRGEVVTLLGPNGAGKTTTIEILEGFRLPSAGTVDVLGPIRRRVTRTGARASVWCFSPGATTRAGLHASSSPI